MGVRIKVLAREWTYCATCVHRVGMEEPTCPRCGDVFVHATTSCLNPEGEASFDVRPFTGLPPIPWSTTQWLLNDLGYADYDQPAKGLRK